MYGIVITDPGEMGMGVYLGYAMGLGFWTRLDPCGQHAAVTFPSLTIAAAHVASWAEGGVPERYTYVAVKPDLVRGSEMYISIEGLKAADLGDLLGDMEREAAEIAFARALDASPGQLRPLKPH